MLLWFWHFGPVYTRPRRWRGRPGRAGECVLGTLLGDALKRISTLSGRFALTSVAAAALWMSMPEAWAVGLGRVAVQSALGENLRAEIGRASCRERV